MTDQHLIGAKSKFIQNGRLGTHLDNVHNSWPKGYLKAELSEVHHILCHACVQDPQIHVTGTDKDFVDRCKRATEWDVNHPDNLIGLPLKGAYVFDYDGHAEWDGLPCHQVDHRRYYEAVCSWLADNVWSKLKGKVDKCDADLVALKGMLEDGSRHWKDFLTNRGKALGGTKLCWDERFGLKKKTWYIPFSMDPGPMGAVRKRRPPPAKLPTSGKLGKIMQLI